MEILDFMGKVCPLPVMGTKKYVDANPDCQHVDICVDNMAAVENVRRFLENHGFVVTVNESDGRFVMSGEKSGTVRLPAGNLTDRAASSRILVMITSDRMGQGDDELGRALMRNFIFTLKEMGSDLWRILILNAGVKLAVEGSESLDDLCELERSGVIVMVCGTCLNHYGILEKKRVGETTNMLDIVTGLHLADKVINI